MSRWWLAMVLSVSPPAFAQEPPDDAQLETVSGQKLPQLRTDTPAIVSREAADLQAVLQGSRVLGLPSEYIVRVKEGFGLVFGRQYPAARTHFAKLEKDYPGTGIATSVEAMIWQALMLENFDFRYDKQYEAANMAALATLQVALRDPKHQAWEHFQMAGLIGVEAIHMVRHGSYLPALSRAFEAMDHAQKAREAAPDFVDLDLADGMYNYWRTVVTLSSKMLPDFGDQRALGIQQMQNAQRSAFFLGDPATLALAFSWLEERDYHKAYLACAANRTIYPDNVINNLLTGQSLVYLRRYDEAIAVYRKIISDAPDNNRVYYHLGVAYGRKGDHRSAIQNLERYLASDHLEGWQRSTGHYRLGQSHYSLKAYKSADYHYRLAVKVDGLKAAKVALERMEQAKKEGKIQY
jgi:tetratricopeptide (TPR) repeat protein